MSDLCYAHPLGVQPSGNFLFDKDEPGFRDARIVGLGMMARLSDELLYQMFGLLDGHTLACVSHVSKAMYVWSQYDEFWKHLVIKEFPAFEWHGATWRQTYAYNYALRRDRNADRQVPEPSIRVRHFYSDFLFQPWLCASMDIRTEWLRGNNIDRRSGMSADEFVREYEQPNRPVVITDATQHWAATHRWSEQFLLDNYGDVVFRAEAMDVPLETYFKYARQCREESPFYLFDKYFCGNCPALAEDFDVPQYFHQDFFKVMGADRRPDHRWLIIGPAKSGSSFHKDPNATSAWNATLWGSKKWIMFPPDVVPPGVFPSDDGSEVVTPTSLMEWFMNFYQQIHRMPVKPLECITGPGDLIFVPSGWWHLVLNLEPTAAITQNFVSDCNLAEVLSFLRCKPDQISGVSCERDVRAFAKEFEEALERQCPGRLERVLMVSGKPIAERNDDGEGNSEKLQHWWNVVTEVEGDGESGGDGGFELAF